MDLFRRLTYLLWYFRRPPWETGIVPPEVLQYIAAHPLRGSQFALDLGCGSGTSSLALARAGWTVTGVDFVPRALRQARRKARREGLPIQFRQADVTRLPTFPKRFHLILDIGCFHGLAASGRQAYLASLAKNLAPGGEWLLYSFVKEEAAPGPGLTPASLAALTPPLELVWRKDGLERGQWPSAWLLLRNPSLRSD